MTLGISYYKQTHLNRLLRLALVLAFVFAIWHVASHDVAIASDQEACQVCLLNHVPNAKLPVLTWFVPLILLSLVLIIPPLKQSSRLYQYILRARSPPLSWSLFRFTRFKRTLLAHGIYMWRLVCIQWSVRGIWYVFQSLPPSYNVHCQWCIGI